MCGMPRLKINLEAINSSPPAEEDGDLGRDGIRLGSLFLRPDGVSSSAGQSYVLSPSDLRLIAMEDGGFLGKGSSGSVRRAMHSSTGNVVAVKEIKLTSQAHLTEIRRELETLYASGSPCANSHLVRFYGAYAHEGSVHIVMECLDGSLDELPKPVPPPVLAHITRGILEGLVYLHRRRHLIHRDLKPSNVLYSRAGDLRISDFGVSSNLECTKGDAHSFVGTVTYMSPERLKGESYSYAADIWSLGLVVAELALGVNPYQSLRSGSTEARFWALLQHLSRDGPALELPAEMEPHVASFITACVVKDPSRRPSCTELLDHPFIRTYCGTATNVAATSSPTLPEPADSPSVAEDANAIRAWLAELRERDVGGGGQHGGSTAGSSGGSPASGVGRADAGATAPHPGMTAAAVPDEPSVNLEDELDKLIIM